MPVSSKTTLVPEDVPLRSDGAQLATEEGCSSSMSNSSNNEAAVLNPQGRTTAEAAGKKTKAAPRQQKPYNCCNLECQNDESRKVRSCSK